MVLRKIGPVGQAVVFAYAGIGAILGIVSLLSNILYYTLGPGAPWWNIGTLGFQAFTAAGIGFVVGVFGALLRAVLWPVSLWVALSGDEPFHSWLLYPWFESAVRSTL